MTSKRPFLLIPLENQVRELDHEIVAWDEDARVHLPLAAYFSRRPSPVSMGCVSHLFAWGGTTPNCGGKDPLKCHSN
jgi:hypothetical protein